MNTQNSANSTQSHALDWDAIQIAQWKFLVSRIDEPAIAALILEQMDANPELAKRSTGLVLRAKTVVIDAQQRATQAKAVQAQAQATLQASNAYRVGNVLGQVFLAARYILLSLTTVLVFLGEFRSPAQTGNGRFRRWRWPPCLPCAARCAMARSGLSTA